ncbi:hypothetical protein ACO34A_03600 [Rhizobium sp. ACO-34A]|nr:hypothetical protein [Rhizobium sp. ACO-34A]ATN32885.1 hypothetical protein ACO34A_03600 [Rhizobium sp. ACO-34A]
MTVALFLVTDRPQAAIPALFGFSAAHAPAWLAVISSIEDLAGIPTGAPVLSLWFSDGSTIETVWREERASRAFDLDYQRHADRIADWLARRDAAEREYCAEARRAELSVLSGGPVAPETPAAETPEPAGLKNASRTSPLTSKWS